MAQRIGTANETGRTSKKSAGRERKDPVIPVRHFPRWRVGASIKHQKSLLHSPQRRVRQADVELQIDVAVALQLFAAGDPAVVIWAIYN